VSASTQNQAKSALLFLYKEVLGSELPWLKNVENAKRPQRLPVVLGRDEVGSLLSRMTGSNGLIRQALRAAGIRMEQPRAGTQRPRAGGARSGVQAQRKGCARLTSSSRPGSCGLRGLPGWMIETWQLSAASTRSRYVPAARSAM